MIEPNKQTAKQGPRDSLHGLKIAVVILSAIIGVGAESWVRTRGQSCDSCQSRSLWDYNHLVPGVPDLSEARKAKSEVELTVELTSTLKFLWSARWLRTFGQLEHYGGKSKCLWEAPGSQGTIQQTSHPKSAQSPSPIHQ